LIDAKTRLTATARGFVRLDGLAFADDQASFLNGSTGKIFNPIRLDEMGNDIGLLAVITGTIAAGVLSSGYDCSDWSSTSGNAAIGLTTDGPGAWSDGAVTSSSTVVDHIFCFMSTKNAALTPTPVGGKKIFASNSPFTVGGSDSPDAACRKGTMPAGVDSANVFAFVATTTAAASSSDKFAATTAQRYVRPDGQVVGTGAQIAAGGILDSGIWQQANESYFGGSNRVWAGGALRPNQLGTAANTCSDWTDNSGTTAAYGLINAGSPYWWHSNLSSPCSFATGYLICVEK